MASPFDIASSMVGKAEVPDRAAIQDYLKTGGANLDPVTAAWCAAFVNSSLTQAGIKGTGSNLARSFLNFGAPVDTPQRGDIAVFSRGAPGSGLGHVGFVDQLNPDGTVRLLSGNSGNSVRFANYPTTGLLGYRRPGEPGAAPLSAPTVQMADKGASAAPGAPPASGLASMFAGPVQPGGISAPYAPQGAAPVLGNLALMFSQQQAERQKQREDEQQAKQTRRAALFGGDSLASLYG